jgi:hypothetical protein
MTGIFDERARTILRNSEENGGLTMRSLFDLVVASHDESVAVAEKLALKVDESVQARMTERAELHEWQVNQAARCASEHKKLFEEEFANIARQAPHRIGDAASADFRDDGVALAFSGGYDREQYDKGIRQVFLTKMSRYLVILIVVILFVSLAYAFFSSHDDLQSDLATGLSSTIAVAMLIWAMMRRER